MATDNPAKLLHDTLNRARAQVTDTSLRALRVFARVFSDQDAQGLARKMTRLQELTNEVRAAVGALELDPGPATRTMNRIETALVTHTQPAWPQFWQASG